MKAAPEWEALEKAVPRDVFQAEVEAWAKRIGVQPKVVQVRRMKRKWGSCSTSGRVSFDTALLRQHAAFRKRVIVEELLHLRIPNHGKLFKSVLRAYLGDSVQGVRTPSPCLLPGYGSSSGPTASEGGRAES